MENITNGKYPLSDCLKSLDDSSKMGLQSVGETLLTHLGENFKQITNVPEVEELSEAMIIRLIEEQKEVKTQTILRLKTFVTWLSANSMENEKKDEVLETFDFEHFTHRDLASDVRKSGLYDIDKILERMDKLFETNSNKLFAQQLESMIRKWDLDRVNTENETLKTKEEEKDESLRLKDEKIDEITEDMKTVKSCFRSKRYSDHGQGRGSGGFNDNYWDKCVSAEMKRKYRHL